MTAALTIRVELALSSSAEDLLSRLLRQDGTPKSIDGAPIYDALIAMEERIEALHAAVQRAWQQPKAPVVDPEPVKNSAPASAQNWFRTTPSERAALLLRVDGGMKPKDLAVELGVRLKSLHDTIYRARQERKLADGSEASTAQPEPAPAPPPSPAPQAATTVRTLDQHRAVAATPSASIKLPTQASAAVVSGNLPPIPRPSGAPQRPGRAALEAEMKAFEAANGVTRLPTITQMAEVGVPTAFLDIAAATKWLTANGHSVRPAGRMRFQINGKPVAATNFVANAQMIAREHAMKLLKERRAG